MLKTERESQRRREVTFCSCRDQRRAFKMVQTLAVKLKQAGPSEIERVASALRP